jgi:transcriptional regulator with XRE-family HTH domain
VSGNNMTARAFLAREIRRARDAKDMSRAALAAKLYVSDSLIAAWESGRIVPRAEQLDQLIDVLEFGPKVISRILDDLVTGEVSPEWTGKWLTIEEKADTLLSFEHSIVPGLLQTEEYASAVLQYLHNAPFDVKEVLSARMERQQRVFDREDPPTAVFIMDEQVLRRQVGSPEVMSRQLLHLVELAEQPNVIVQIVPSGAGYHPGLAGAFMIAKFDGVEIAFQDGTITGHVLEDREQVSELARMWENIHAAALPQVASIELIAKVAEEWKS